MSNNTNKQAKHLLSLENLIIGFFTFIAIVLLLALTQTSILENFRGYSTPKRWHEAHGNGDVKVVILVLPRGATLDTNIRIVHNNVEENQIKLTPSNDGSVTLNVKKGSMIYIQAKYGNKVTSSSSFIVTKQLWAAVCGDKRSIVIDVSEQRMGLV